MARFIYWALIVGLSISYGPYLATLTLKMAKAAALAHKHDQMSYARFTQKLLNAKPRAIPKRPNDSELSH